MRPVQTFPDGEILFEHCERFGFEGVVSKRLSSRYMSGPSGRVASGQKQNASTGNERMSTGTTFRVNRKPVETERERELRKKRAELARVLAHLQTPGFSPGNGRELRKHVIALQREIAALISDK